MSGKLASLMLPFVLAAALVGCGTGVRVGGAPRTELNAGYAALYDVVSRNAGITALLIVKDESQPVHDLVTDVAEHCKQAKQQLEEFKKGDVLLNYNAMGLPVVDSKARASIDTHTTAALVTSFGRRFDYQLVYTQLRATSYIAGVAESLVNMDTNKQRRIYLKQLTDDFQKLNQRLFDLLMQLNVEAPQPPAPQTPAPQPPAPQPPAPISQSSPTPAPDPHM
jgi:hypothetical protein